MIRIFKIIIVVGIAILVAGAVVIRGIHSRIDAAAVIREKTLDQSIPSVAVIYPKRGELKDEIALPGNIQAFVDAPVYARTNGYLKKWYSDIGTRVKAGDLLAEIESPEIDQQLSQARADLGTAQANMKLAGITMNRYQGLLKLDAIAKQDVDNAIGTYEADKATVASQTANVKRLEQLVAFEKVFAPFDGIISARNIDVGQLINAGNGGAAQELFHISSATKLRIFISVPQIYADAAVPGVNADLTLTETPGRPQRGVTVSDQHDGAGRGAVHDIGGDLKVRPQHRDRRRGDQQLQGAAGGRRGGRAVIPEHLAAVGAHHAAGERGQPWVGGRAAHRAGAQPAGAGALGRHGTGWRR